MADSMQRILRLLVTAIRVTWWIAVTMWLGARGILSVLRFGARLPKAFAVSLVCPRGHQLELYGTFKCSRCKAGREGAAFDPCGVCGARASYLRCDRCGLAVKAPLL